MILPFLSGHGRFFANHRMQQEDGNAPDFDEQSFRRTLLHEFKRSAVSKRPFILMLISLSDIPSVLDGNDRQKQIVASVASSIRDTDVLGWYKAGSVLGVLFTEFGDSAEHAVDPIMERVHGSLEAGLRAEELKRLSIALYMPPVLIESLPSEMPVHPERDIRYKNLSALKETPAYH